ncbi:MAG: hypothetical protein ACRD0S_06220 [Acidimicrobiales bacterium]
MVARRSVSAMAAMVAAGGALMFFAWYQATGTVEVDDQVSWSGVGLAGALVVCLAALMGVRLVRRAVRVRVHDVSAELERRLAREAVPAEERPRGTDAALVAAPNMRYYHRPDCALAAGKPVRPDSRAVHESAGLRRCQVCEA